MNDWTRMIRVVNVKGLRGDDRKGVCYVGRAFAGWPASPWGNPYRTRSKAWWNVRACLDDYGTHARKQPSEWLASLWEACDKGAKPLGCWCVDAVHGDGQPIVCHAQILAAMLAERFGTKEEPTA